MINAAPTAILELKPKITKRPDKVASATPKPPGIKLTAPTMDAKLYRKTESTKLMDCPNPWITKKMDKHSRNHAKTANNDIPTKYLDAKLLLKVSCISFISPEYLPALVSKIEIRRLDMVSDLIAIIKAANKITRINNT